MSSTLFHFLTLSLAGLPAAQGLISLWAATSRRHWFLRALVVWGGIVLLLPIRAYEPAAVLAIASLVIVLLVRTKSWVDRRWEHKLSSPPLQFGLRDLLLCMLLVGLIVVTFQGINRGYTLHEWVAFAITGSLMGAVVCVAAGLAVGPRRWLMSLLLATVIVASVPIIEATARDSSRAQALWEALGALYNAPFNLPSMLATALAFVELAGFILVGVSLVYFRWAGRSNGLRIARRVALTLAAVECAWLAWLYYQMLFLTPFPPPFAGGTNHYRRIAEIAQLLGGNRGQGPVPGTDTAALADEARRLLEDSNYVDFNLPSRALTDIHGYISDASAMREIGRVFAAEAKAAVVREEFDLAAELGVANLELGTMMNRGGTVIDSLVGDSCRGAGIGSIVQVRGSLSPTSMRATIAALQRALSEQEDIEIITQRDAAIEERADGWQSRLQNIFLGVANVGSAGHDTLNFGRRRLTARNVLLQTDLAIRLYRHDHAELPKSLSDLVPDYLPEVPRDPLSRSGDAIHYRPDGDAYLIYSAGLDGKDNGGTLAKTNQEYWQSGRVSRFDYDLETDNR